MNSGLKKIVILLLAVATFGSCLKNNDLYEGFEGIKPIADIPLSRLSSDTLTIYALEVAPSSDATIDTLVAVHLSAKDHVGNVTFSLGLGTSDSAFVKFMNDHPEYTLMPSNLYSFDSSVTIENAGVLTTANFPVKFKTAAVDADGNNLFINNQYVLPIIIKDAGGYGIASNFRMIVMSVLAKNRYDGIYELHIRTTGWAAYGISDDETNVYPYDFSLITAGATEVNFYSDGSGSGQPALTSAGASTSFGATQPRLTFDPVTNKLISVSNDIPDDGRGRTFYINPAITDSRYDPDTKSVYAAYIMTQNGRPLQYIYDTLYYQGPR